MPNSSAPLGRAEAPLSGDDGRPVQEGGCWSCPPGRPESGDVPEPAIYFATASLPWPTLEYWSLSVQPLGSGGAPSPCPPIRLPIAISHRAGDLPSSRFQSVSLLVVCVLCVVRCHRSSSHRLTSSAFQRDPQALPFVLTLDRPDFVSHPFRPFRLLLTLPPDFPDS